VRIERLTPKKSIAGLGIGILRGPFQVHLPLALDDDEGTRIHTSLHPATSAMARRPTAQLRCPASFSNEGDGRESGCRRRHLSAMHPPRPKWHREQLAALPRLGGDSAEGTAEPVVAALPSVGVVSRLGSRPHLPALLIWRFPRSPSNFVSQRVLEVKPAVDGP